MVKIKACIFISGNGSNLKSLIKSSREYNFPINISCVISSTKKANGLYFAKRNKIPYYILNLDNQLNIEIILQKLKEKNISLICLAGYMKILKKNFIKKFSGQIINIHPSLLPKYKGLDTFNRVLKFKEKITGCTIHHVSAELDAGQKILQKKVFVGRNDNEKSLRDKVQKVEHKAYAEAIIKLFRTSL
ncbi:phosphoribosylglycinamide formyltransferase [Pelagibacteraceae bacterium]|nr:phosphoribosylglycinamide formyltransferase [Pelagibacteraceae bacterium]